MNGSNLNRERGRKLETQQKTSNLLVDYVKLSQRGETMRKPNEELELTEFEKEGLKVAIKLLKFYFATVNELKLEQILETIITTSNSATHKHTTLAERTTIIRDTKSLINKIFKEEE